MPASAQRSALKTIIIDPGHGLPDPGARGRHSNESDIALAVAKKLAKKLRDSVPGVRVLLTRTDRNLPGKLHNARDANRWRAKFANANHGDLFICIHCNDASSRSKTAVGTETYVWAMNKNDSKQDFVQENGHPEELFGENSDTSGMTFSTEEKILASLRTKKYFSRSLLLANLIENQYISKGRRSRGVKQRNEVGIWVLQATAMPSILTEIGFLTNRQEEDYMNSQGGQDQISSSIMRAVIQYKKQLDAGRVH